RRRKVGVCGVMSRHDSSDSREDPIEVAPVGSSNQWRCRHGELENGKTTAWRQRAKDLGTGHRGVFDISNAERDRHGVDRSGSDWNARRVTADERDRAIEATIA